MTCGTFSRGPLASNLVRAITCDVSPGVATATPVILGTFYRVLPVPYCIAYGAFNIMIVNNI